MLKFLLLFLSLALAISLSYKLTSIGRRIHRIELNLFNKKTSSSPLAIKVSQEQKDIAWSYWQSQNGFMKETAPNYLDRAACDRKFLSLVKAVDDVSTALEVIKTDSFVLSYREEKVAESYAAWCEKINKDEARALILRQPPVLSLSKRAVDNITVGK